MSVTAYFLTPGERLRNNLSEAEVADLLASRHGLLWVDVTGCTEKDGFFLSQTFQFHPLSIEDCVSEEAHTPKIDDYGEYIFIAVQGVHGDEGGRDLTTLGLALFLGRNFVVTAHREPIARLDYVRGQLETVGGKIPERADFLAHSFLDALVDGISPAIDETEDAIEEIEDEVIEDPRRSTLVSIAMLKRSARRMHRIMSAQREVLNRLSRGEFSLIGGDALPFYRDVYDHMVRIDELNQHLRDRAESALAMYLSSLAIRQNNQVRVLAVVASIFLPLALLTGIYGMNFENIPELKWSWGYYALTGLILGVLTLCAAWFGWRAWVNWRSRTDQTTAKETAASPVSARTTDSLP